jgi:hypothetical protein
MNWSRIKEKCPNAWGMTFSSVECFYDANDELVFTNSIRDLYDFFDENKIHINIESYFGGWNYYIEDKEYQIIGDDGYYDYKTRTEAEEKAFEKAFEILEGRIK